MFPGHFTVERSASWVVRMLTVSIASLGFIYAPIIIYFPSYPPAITSQLYDCEAPGPSTIRDYVELGIFSGLNIIIAVQTFIDAIVHGAYIAFLCCTLLVQYISIMKRLISVSMIPKNL